MNGPREFDTFEELGRWAKADNPHLIMPDRRAGQKYLKTYPNDVRVKEAEGPAPGGSWSVINRGISSFGSVMGKTAEGTKEAWNTTVETPIGWGGDVAQGFTSGASLGLPKLAARLMGQDTYGQGIMFKGGEMIGEIWGPYRVAQKVVGGVSQGVPAVNWMAGRFPQLGRTIGAGAEATMVEGGKAGIEGENPLEYGALAFVVAAGAEGMLRGGYKAGKAGVEKLLGPRAGERDIMDPLVNFLRKHDLPVPPALVRPFSNTTQYMHRRVTHTAATNSLMKSTHIKLTQGIERLQKRTVRELRGGIAPLSPTQVGQVIADGIEDTGKWLQQHVDEAYGELRKTEIGSVPIDVNQVVTRKFRDGTEVQGKILDAVHDAIGGGIIDDASKAQLGWQKRLRTLYLELREAHHTIDVGKDVPINEMTGNPTWSAVLKNLRSPVQKAAAGSDINLVVQGDIAIPQYSYNWWWKKLQLVGAMLEEPKVKQSRKAHRAVQRTYHAMRDFMDAQASAVDPTYELAIMQARAFNVAFENYNDNPLVRSVLSFVEGDKKIPNREKVLDVVFGSTDSIREAKRFLGPEGYDAARQGWVRDLLQDCIERDVEGNITFVNATKLDRQIAKYTDGLEGEYFKELFSDTGFMGPMGDPIPADTQGAWKKDQLAELVEKVTLLSQARQMMKGGTEEMTGSMAEKFAPGPKLFDPKELMRSIKGLMANLMLLGQGGKQYMKESDNLFLGGKLPEMMEGAIPGWAAAKFPGMSGETRRHATSYIANRFLNP